MKKSGNIFGRFFGVVIRGQTYLNILYLLLALPLGVFYYIFLVGLFVTGIPLVFIFIGLLILIAVFAAWVAFVAFERQLAIWLLSVDVPPYMPEVAGQKDTSGWIGGFLTNRVTWTGLLFLFLKFPLGVFSFALLTTLFALTIAFLSAPFTYNLVPLDIWVTWDVVWSVDTLWKALILFVFGIFMIFISLHLLNIMAWIWGRLAYWMLGRKPKSAIEEPISPPPAVEAPVGDAPEVVDVEAGNAQETLVEPEPQSVAALESDPAGVQSAAGVAAAGAVYAEMDESPPASEVESSATSPPWDESGDSDVLITPPPSQETAYINEADLPSAKGAQAADISPPAWLLDEEAPAAPSAETQPESSDDASQVGTGAETDDVISPGAVADSEQDTS